MKTYSAKVSDLRPEWHVLDAAGETLGRLASKVAQLLKGKHKPTYTPHMDMSDFIIVINADKVQVTGNKEKNKQ